ncbi:Peptidase family M48 [Thalassolituus maritimus]|uniref:Peptidase family M48 n=2 Tax=Thalassolituus maritimus TaxID=484498 RepID=A0A1N7N7I0_9GAMM|nr:Peptidase family M48 [Thalassolituus maritimus]
MQRITGKYCMAGRSDIRPAILLLRDDGSLRVLATDFDYELTSTTLKECRQGDVLPGIPVELHFDSGDYFIPEDPDLRWTPRSGFLAYLESHMVMVLAAALMVPLSFWLVFTQVIPAGAKATAPLVPQEVLNRVGRSSMKTLDYSLEPSRLAQYEQASIIKDWNKAAEKAGLDNDYRILFRSAIAPNAFALPDGTIVVFDELVNILSRDELIAVLFHEAGHVDRRHGAQMMVQASAGAIVYGLLLGDLEGLSEVVLGTGISLGENAFSRTMETDADDFAVEHLKAAGMSPDLLASALNSLPGSQRETNSWREYLSTHPERKTRTERIESASD